MFLLLLPLPQVHFNNILISILGRGNDRILLPHERAGSSVYFFLLIFRVCVTHIKMKDSWVIFTTIGQICTDNLFGFLLQGIVSRKFKDNAFQGERHYILFFNNILQLLSVLSLQHPGNSIHCTGILDSWTSLMPKSKQLKLGKQ